MAALDAAQKYRVRALPEARANAAGWVTTLASVAGVLTVASVVSVVNTLKSINGLQWVAILLLGVGVIAVLVALVQAYMAAHDDGDLPETAREIIDGADYDRAAERWNLAIAELTTDVARRVKTSMVASILGVLALLAAYGVLWYAATVAPAATGACVEIGGVITDATAIKPVSDTTTVALVPCPSPSD